MSKKKIEVILLGISVMAVALAVLVAGIALFAYTSGSNETFDTAYELCGEPDDVMVKKDSMLVVFDYDTSDYGVDCVLAYMNVDDQSLYTIDERAYYGQPKYGFLEIRKAMDDNRFKHSFVMSEHGEAFLFEPVG